jgi:ATP-dependent exoDNAse (exonuclease V) beta subunit
MIRASAGSGKTYRLTERVVKLLEAGAEPERIVALTFTRKAAGEFFDQIVDRLAELADERPATHLPLLRRMIDSMPKLRLSTVDAFFGQIVRGFPFELGLTGDFELLQEHAAILERRRVLRRMYSRAHGGLQAAQIEFIEAFKQATMGAEEKKLAVRLDKYLNEHHQIFLSASAQGLWGDPRRIWPDGPLWGRAPKDISTALQTLRDWAKNSSRDPKLQKRWLDFCDAIQEWTAGVPISGPLEYVLKKTLYVADGLRHGTAELKFERTVQALDQEASQAVADLSLNVAAQEYQRRITITQGIQKILLNYESFYHEAVRRGGRLTFSDIQRLLEPTTLLAAGESIPEDGRLAIDYRLDGGIDHWLLDEFQDTSFGQWSVLENLIDEAITDPTGARTFFCVGDVKQAIYGWRQGDHRLFGEILAKYNGAQPGTIAEEPLLQSWRSAPPIIDFVNAVFGRDDVMTELFKGPASEGWNAEWRDHSSARPELSGQAVLLLADDQPARMKCTLDLLLEIDPVERGLSCAVLVLSNNHAKELAEYLRQEGGLPAVEDADLHVCTDNPVGSALLALVQAAEHPGDQMAWQHARMSPPLAAWMDARGWSTPDGLATGLLGQLQREGYARALAALLAELAPSFPAGDRFNAERARQFVGAAAQFDESGGRSASEFVEFMEQYSLREPESAAVIRVMTVHKSKGLGFDMVVVPDLKRNSLLEAGDGLGVKRDPSRQVEWILDMPNRLFSETDPVMRDLVEGQKAAKCYELLAVLYVALTRAKRGLYVIAEPVKANSVSNNYHRLLADTLGSNPVAVQVGGQAFNGVWQAGDPQWFQTVAKEEAEPPAPALQPVAGVFGAPRLVAHRPSGEAGGSFALDGAFALAGPTAADFGSAVHSLLADVEWADREQREALAARWRREELAWPEALAAAEGCLRDETNRAIWEKPDGAVEVWRERSFEMTEGSAWYSGTFDRVIVRRTADGQIVSVEVVDFKTVRGEPDSRRYDAQLDIYRKAAARLTGAPASSVRSRLVWMRV